MGEYKKPDSFEEFRKKYQDVLIEKHPDDAEMLLEFFDLLEESNYSSDRTAIRRQFERLFHYMQKYQYQPDLQYSHWVYTMLDASDELSGLSIDAKQIWRITDSDNLDVFYNTARRKFIRECRDPKEAEYLDKTIPTTVPEEFTKENCANTEFIKRFCKQYVNKNKPEMVKFINNMR
jgi:hypothetical protein